MATKIALSQTEALFPLCSYLLYGDPPQSRDEFFLREPLHLLPSSGERPTFATMRKWYDNWRQNGTVRLCLFVFGLVLIGITPLVAVVPGPGGIFVFALGLAIVLQNSLWAKRRYVHFKRRWPKQGDWTDWGLRRESYRRRTALQKRADS